MPAFDHHFVPLYPPLEGDSYLELQAQGLINFQTRSGHELLVRYLCQDEQVRVIAVAVPEAAASHKDLSKWMKQIVENSISAIRLSGDPGAVPVLHDDGFITLMYQSDDQVPQYRYPIEFTRNSDYQLSISNVLGVFCAIGSKAVSPIAALLAEGQVPTIPPHYRALSLIRAIELLYPEQRDRDEALDKFDGHFGELQIDKHSFRKALPQLRTRCAHGTSRGRINPEPFIGVGYNEPQLLSLVTLLRSVVAHGLQTLHGLEFGGMQYGPTPDPT